MHVLAFVILTAAAGPAQGQATIESLLPRSGKALKLYDAPKAATPVRTLAADTLQFPMQSHRSEGAYLAIHVDGQEFWVRRTDVIAKRPSTDAGCVSNAQARSRSHAMPGAAGTECVAR